MNSVQALKDLVGQPEDADFDCKEWPTRSDAARGMIAKAACGFSNATGGVIIIGLRASGRGADMPDVVQSLAPLADRKTVASEALDIILKFVEPGIEGVKVKTIPYAGSESSGFVVIFVPPSESAVRRSKVDWRFYVRIASGTLPMEYFQVEERFGRRPLPRLSLHIQPLRMLERSGHTNSPLRHLLFGLKNDGRGIAKFAGIRFARSANVHRGTSA
jgi:predicted HTH transcriptional regulator